VRDIDRSCDVFVIDLVVRDLRERSCQRLGTAVALFARGWPQNAFSATLIQWIGFLIQWDSFAEKPI
jgi:hypothetical protein